jgi:uncharacterized membrane protein YdjX (TVP38/TMEM64 family)
MNKQIKKIKFWILILIIALCLATAIYFHIKGISFNISSIEDVKFAPLYFILIYVAISFIPIPIAPIMFVGGFIFPFLPAVFATLVGSTIFSTISFYMARYLGRDYYEDIESKNKKLKKLDLRLREDPFENLLLLRLFFIIPGEIINIYAGLSKIRFRDFLMSTTIASIPLIMCCIGIIRGRLLNDWIALSLSIIGLLVMLIIPIIFSYRIRKKICSIFQ